MKADTEIRGCHRPDGALVWYGRTVTAILRLADANAGSRMQHPRRIGSRWHRDPEHDGDAQPAQPWRHLGPSVSDRAARVPNFFPLRFDPTREAQRSRSDQ